MCRGARRAGFIPLDKRATGEKIAGLSNNYWRQAVPNRRRVLVAAAAAACSVAARAQMPGFPNRPLSLLVGFPSSSVDQLMRVLADGVSRDLGQPVVVFNQPGVSGTMAPATMARTAAPDGHTLAFLPSTLLRLPHMQKVPYDALNDFTYVIGLYTTTAGVMVRSDAPWKSLPQLLGYAKANPDKVSFGGVGTGTPAYFALQRLGRQAGFKPVYVPFKGGPDLYGALLGGHLEVIVEGGFGPYLDAGKVRALAVFEPERVRYWPDLPTAREQGFDAVVQAVGGIGGPKGMDPAIVKVLHDSFKRAADGPEFQRVLRVHGYPMHHLASDDYRAFARSFFASEKRAIEESGFRLE